jgi:hypothetical protein
MAGAEVKTQAEELTEKTRVVRRMPADNSVERYEMWLLPGL